MFKPVAEVQKKILSRADSGRAREKKIKQTCRFFLPVLLYGYDDSTAAVAAEIVRKMNFKNSFSESLHFDEIESSTLLCNTTEEIKEIIESTKTSVFAAFAKHCLHERFLLRSKVCLFKEEFI